MLLLYIQRSFLLGAQVKCWICSFRLTLGKLMSVPNSMLDYRVLLHFHNTFSLRPPNGIRDVSLSFVLGQSFVTT